MRVVALLCLAFAACALASVPFQSCDSTSPVTVNTIDISPFPPTKGSNVVFTLHGTSSEEITAGNYSLSVSYLGISILTKGGDLCTLDPNFHCPSAAGPIVVSDTLAVPSIAPSGAYTVSVKATDGEGNTLLCVTLEFTMSTVAEIAAPMVYEPEQTIPFTTCASGTPATVKAIDVEPWPVTPGVTVNISVDAALSEEITGGNYAIQVSYIGIPILTKTGDICTLDPAYPCPFQAGPLSLWKAVAVPSIAPAGSYAIQVSATDNSTAKNTIFCVTVDLNIGSAKPTHPFSYEENAPAQSQALIDHVNSLKTTWTAGFNPRFANHTMKQVKGLCGSLKEKKRLPLKRDLSEVVMDIPTEFDSRKQWGSICPSTNDIRDQGSCGSCWAFGAVEAMTDRICIATNGTRQPYLSAEDVLSCCGFECGMGCDGGYPSAAWSYFDSTGVVTGGPYNSNQGCYPYQVPACEHHVSGPLPPCGNIVNTPSCTQSCLNGLNWSSDKNMGSTSYSLPSDVASIQKEIMTYGPVEASFTVYSDFVSYKSGVYQYTTGDELGGHAIKILGWGVENNLPYWLVANSWNTGWGEQGYFKILRGSDECGIEDGVVAGQVPA